MIPTENEEWHGVCSSGRSFSFQHKQKEVIASHILYGYTEFPCMIKSFSDNYSKSSAERLVFALYSALVIAFITIQPKPKRKLRTNSYLQFSHSIFCILNIYSTDGCVLFAGLHFWSNLGCYRLFMWGFRFWSITRSEILLSSMLKVSSKEFYWISFMIVVV